MPAIIVVALWLVAAVPAAGVSRDEATGIELRGTLITLAGDPQPGSALQAADRYLLRSSDGSTTRLTIDASRLDTSVGSVAANRQDVIVRGERAPDGSVRVRSLDLASPSPVSPGTHATGLTTGDAQPMAVSRPAVGEQRWLNILCRFADSSAVTPRSAEWIDALFGQDEPRIGHYWTDVSYSAFRLSETTTAGWYTLPQPRATYVITTGDGGFTYFDQTRATDDCTAAADAEVDFPAYDGVNLMFNQELDGYAWGGFSYLNRDGQERTYGMTWLPVWGYENQYVTAHEMGHALGLPHSSGAYEATYDSEWDVMSQGGTCNPPSDEFGCIGVHPIGYHKELLGWLPETRVTTVSQPGTVALTIDALSEAAGSSNLLLVKVPIQLSPTRYYTVEVRRQSGYDKRVPGEAVLLHLVDTARWDRQAQVVDPDLNFNPNDDGAQWIVGETFTDQAAGISISVDARTASGFKVTVSTDNSFARTWDRTDRPVQQRRAERTWMWGPQSLAGPIVEPYYDAPSGDRTVVYYDKARMEITDPASDSSSLWYVTNGLLVVELMTGLLQLSDTFFEAFPPAAVNVAGDPGADESPTYATFGLVRDHAEPDQETVIQRGLRRDGTIYDSQEFASYGIGTAAFSDITGHWIAAPFWEFMQSNGLVYEDGEFVSDVLFKDPYYATGLPVSDAYWATVELGGTRQDVLMQCFERRCLTYTPANPDGWKVEAGNVGQHYYTWRYEQIDFDD